MLSQNCENCEGREAWFKAAIAVVCGLCNCYFVYGAQDCLAPAVGEIGKSDRFLSWLVSGFPYNSSCNPLNVTLGMIITIRNPNYGSFQYINSTSYVKFHDTVVAEVPIEAELVPARSQINVNTSADFMVAKLINDPNFLSDVLGGTLNFTSTIALPGKARMLNIIKLKATSYSTCDISVNISSRNVDTNCKSKIKL